MATTPAGGHVHLRPQARPQAPPTCAGSFMLNLNIVCWSGAVGQYCPFKHYPSPGFLSFLFSSSLLPIHTIYPLQFFPARFYQLRWSPRLY